MDNRKWLSGANATTPPSAPGSPSTGYPDGGTPGVTPATNPGPYWFHQIGEELRAVLVAASITPNQGTLTQLRDAVLALAGGGVTILSSGGIPYGIKVGPLIIQTGTVAVTSGGVNSTNTITYGTAFPNATLGISGNADKQGNGVWGPAVVMFPRTAWSTTGASAFVDTGNPGQVLQAGINVNYLAWGY